MKKIENIVFDIGNVLLTCGIGIYLRNVYGDSFSQFETKVKEAISPDWIRELDEGKDFEQAICERIKLNPNYEKILTDYSKNYHKTIGDKLFETCELAEKYVKSGSNVFALSNWPKQKVDLLYEHLPFLGSFTGVVVSGEVGCAKPNPEIYRYMVSKYELEPEETVFIDDLAENIQGAERLGFVSHQYVGYSTLTKFLGLTAKNERN